MLSPFTPDGKLSVSALRNLQSVAEGTRRHIAGSGNFFTSAGGGTHSDSTPPQETASGGAFIQIVSIEAQEITLQNGEKAYALPAQRMELTGQTYTPVEDEDDGVCWYLPPNGEMPPLNTVIAVQQAGTDTDDVPIFSVQLMAAVIQITGPIIDDVLTPLEVQVVGAEEESEPLLVYEAKAAILIPGTGSEQPDTIAGVVPCYAFFPLSLASSPGVLADQNPQYLGYYLGVMIGRAFVVGDNLNLQATGTTDEEVADEEEDTNETDEGAAVETGGGDPNPILPVYAFLPNTLNAVVCQVQGPVDEETGELVPLKVDQVNVEGQVDCYTGQYGILGPSEMAPAVECFIYTLEDEKPAEGNWYLGVLIGRGVEEGTEEPILNIYGIRIGAGGEPDSPPEPPPLGPEDALDHQLDSWPFPPYFAYLTATPYYAILNGLPVGPFDHVLDAVPPPVDAILIGVKPPPFSVWLFTKNWDGKVLTALPKRWRQLDAVKGLAWPRPDKLIWTIAGNLYEPNHVAFPLKSLWANNNCGNAAFGRIVFHCIGDGTMMADWQGFFTYNSFSGYSGPEPDLEFANSGNVNWTIKDQKAFFRHQVKATVNLPYAGETGSDTNLSVSGWKNLNGMFIELQPGSVYLIVVQLNAAIMPQVAGDSISCRLYDGSSEVGCPVQFCYALCAGQQFIDAACLTAFCAVTGAAAKIIYVQGKIVPAGDGSNVSATVLGCDTNAGSSLSAVQIGQVVSLSTG